MKFNKATIGAACILIMLNVSAIGQPNFELATDAKGSISKGEKILSYIKSLKALSPSKAVSLAATTEKVQVLICSSPFLNPPIGFNARMNLSTVDYSLKEKEPQGLIFCYLRYLMRNKNTGDIKTSMDGADIYFYLNDFDIFRQMGNYWKDCSDLHYPLFLEKPEYIDSTDNYFTFMLKGDPVRIVCGNDQPLLVPLTRAEFIKFLILRAENALQEEEEAFNTSKASKVSLEKMLTTAKESDKAIISSSIKSVENNLAKFNENQVNIQTWIINYHTALKNLSAEEAKSPVRINYSKKSDEPRFGGLGQVVPTGRKEGVALVKINPGYYNHAPGAPAVQMMVVYYAIPDIEMGRELNHTKKAALDIFEHIDYQALKAAMK